MKVVVREAAYADLERIYRWIESDSPQNARSVLDRIYDAIDRMLATFPYAGHPGKAPGTYEWVVRGLPYIVVYRIDARMDELTVLAIFHAAQDR
jgi:plasmid stabilization system protein ParE